MRRIPLVAALATAALLALPVAPAGAAAPCTASEAHEYASSSNVRVFSAPASQGPARVYACVVATNRRTLLGYDGDCVAHPDVRTVRLDEPYLAYAVRRCEGGWAAHTIVLRDIGSGKVLRQVPARSPVAQGAAPPGDEVVSLELSAGGAVAWTTLVGPDRSVEVHKLDRSAQDGALLDSGSEIDPYSLAVARRPGHTHAFWFRSDGGGRTAVLAALGAITHVRAARPLRCTRSGARTILDAGGKRVFSLPASGGDRRVYGCLNSQNRPRFLGWQKVCRNGPGVSGFRFAGALLAYVEQTCGAQAGRANVVVRDVRRNTVTQRVPGATGATSAVSALEISATGGLVWAGAGDGFQVWKADPGKQPTLVDSGPGIEPASLALGRYEGFNRLYWLKDGAPSTAVLSGF
jgi:hypothetical protein